jgi:hypothetical protein
MEKIEWIIFINKKLIPVFETKPEKIIGVYSC